MSNLISLSETARRLNVTGRDAAKLSQAGLLGPSQHVGRMALHHADQVAELAAWTDLPEQTEPILVVRVGPATAITEHDPAWAKRKWIGWGATYPGVEDQATEQTRRDAIRGWWRVATPEQYQGHPLVVCLGGMTLGAYLISGHDRSGSQVRFTLTDLPESTRKALVGHRLRLPQGAIAMPLKAGQPAS